MSAEQSVSRQTSILVLGAGELGMAVLRSLAGQAASLPHLALSVLLRPQTEGSLNPGKQQTIDELHALGIGMVFGDLASSSEEELARVFKRFSTVIGCTGFVAGNSIQHKLARAVLAAEVGRYFPWQFGVDYDVIGRGSAQDLFDEQLEVRDLLRSQERTEWVIISTGMFTSFLFEPSFGVVDLEQNTVHALGSWENAVTVTTPEDIGMLTAQIVAAEPKIVNRVIYTAGDTITYAEVADILDRVLRRQLHREVRTVARLREELARAPQDSLRKYRVVFAEGKGVAWPMEQTFNAARQIPVISAERWVRENLTVKSGHDRSVLK